eukprot:3544187-Pleurochrysis_carterae.AAC.3
MWLSICLRLWQGQSKDVLAQATGRVLTLAYTVDAAIRQGLRDSGTQRALRPSKIAEELPVQGGGADLRTVLWARGVKLS